MWGSVIKTGCGCAVGVALALWAPFACANDQDARLMPEIRLAMHVADGRPALAEAAPGFAATLGLGDRFDLGRFRTRFVPLSVGPVEMHFLARRTIGPDRARDALLRMDKWNARTMAFDAAIDLGGATALMFDASITKMSRRMAIMPVTTGRLSTGITTFGTALMSGPVQLGVAYVRVKRGGRPSDLTRFAESVGGAPLTGRGTQFSLASRDQGLPNTIGWRFTMASMQRPARDLNFGSTGALADKRAMMSLSLHL